MFKKKSILSLVGILVVTDTSGQNGLGNIVYEGALHFLSRSSELRTYY